MKSNVIPLRREVEFIKPTPNTSVVLTQDGAEIRCGGCHDVQRLNSRQLLDEFVSLVTAFDARHANCRTEH